MAAANVERWRSVAEPLKALAVKAVTPAMIQQAQQGRGLLPRVAGYAGQLVGSAFAGFRKGAQEPFNPADMPIIPPNPEQADPPPGGNPGEAFSYDHFGPGQPIIADPLVQWATMGRTWDFLAGLNLTYTPKGGEGLPYAMLRALAGADYMLNYCIETREDQIASLDWHIQSRDAIKSDKPDKDALLIEKSWKIPGKRENGQVFGRMPFNRHQRRIMNDRFVCDAATMLKWSTKSGGVYGLEWMDGTLIKPNIDTLGKIVEPPLPAYSVILKGIPRYHLDSNHLIWDPRNVRPGRQYGFSRIEQALMIILMALKRDAFMLNYYTMGNLPPALISLPEKWTDKQVKEYQDKWDARLEGNLKERQKLQWIPGGQGVGVHELKGELIKTPFDEWRARVYCALFSLPASPFIAQVNKGTSRDARDEAMQEGLIPDAQGLEEFWDQGLSIFYDRPDLCLRYELHESTNPVARAQADQVDLEDGLLTINKALENRGVPGIGPLGDVHRFKTASGWTPIERVDEPPPEPVVAAPGAAAGGIKPKPKANDHGGNPATGDDVKSGDEDEHGARVVKAGKGKRGRIFVAPHNPHQGGASDRLTSITHDHLQRAGSAAARHLLARYVPKDENGKGGMTKKAIAAAVESVNLDGLHGLIGPYEKEMRMIGHHQTKANLSAIAIVQGKHKKDEGDEPEGLFKADEQVIEYARTRSAEMVGMKRKDDGTLVPDPRADMSIDETTRALLRRDITSAMTDGIMPKDFVSYLVDTYNFSEYRARTIADTEMSRANQAATLASWQHSGQVEGKSWQLSEDHDTEKEADECDDNADEGTIPIGSLFPSGDMAAPAHPNCRCGIRAHLMDVGDEALDE
jgi:hypothetical protein